MTRSVVRAVLAVVVALAGLATIGASAPGRAAAATATTAATAADGVGWVVPGARVEPIDAGELDVGGLGAYAGAIEMQAGGGGLAVVNRVSLDDYVRGIAEIPSDWPAAALEAQAIAARTYALRELLLGHVLCATEACQVYAGLAKERADTGGWAAAVAATRDQVLLWKGAPILAMYSSSNGGQMVPGSQPYLRGGADPDDAIAPVHIWHSSVPLAALQSAFSTPGPVTAVARTGHDTIALTWSSGSPPPNGPAPASNPQPAPPPARSSTTASASSASSSSAASYASASEGPPATTADLPSPDPSTTTTTAPGDPGTTQPPAPASTSTTQPPPPPPSTTTSTTQAPPTTGQQEVGTGAFVQTLNSTQPPPNGLPRILPSYRFEVRVDSAAGTAVFDGRGFGHGIGMSQFGALGKARRGLHAADILAAYYGGIRPSVAAPGSLPSVIPVTLDEARPAATVSSPGRFRVSSSDGTVLAVAASGDWQFTPAPGGKVRVMPPADQQGPLRLVPLGARRAGDPSAGGTVEVTLSLSLSAFVRASLVPVAPPTTVAAGLEAATNVAPPAPPDATPAPPPSPPPAPPSPGPAPAAVTTAAPAAPAGPGDTVVALPLGAAAPDTTWIVHLEADAGGGRVATVDVPLDAIPAAATVEAASPRALDAGPRRPRTGATGGTGGQARPLLLLAVATLALIGAGGTVVTNHLRALVARASSGR